MPASSIASTSTVGPSTPVASLVGIGASYAARLERLGILTVQDLLFHLPRRHEDSRLVTPLRQLRAGDVHTSQVTVRSIHGRQTPRKKIFLVEASLVDDGVAATAVWFNQKHLLRLIQPGMELLVNGRVEGNAWDGLTFRNPSWEQVGREQRHVGRLVPVYPETEKLSSRWLRTHIEPLLPVANRVVDRLPEELRSSEGLMPIGEALRQLHFPQDDASRDRAHERVAFEEHFLLQLAAERARRNRLRGVSAVVPYDVTVARAFAASLPFSLTGAQRAAAHTILSDMAASGPMNRLLQGDVGSGKTVVAAMAIAMTHAAGLQAAVMAPTEILARQHHATLTALLDARGITPRLLVGSTPARARREILEAVAQGHETLLVGTHALIEDDVLFNDLGLVIVDEQHRFGVNQRQRLRNKGSRIPNFLAMTATPIPRSLALTLYGDVNVSELREMPPGRWPVATRVVPPHQREDAYAFIREQVAVGRQAFVVCPVIEESDKLGVRSATAEYERLSRDVFPDLHLELLHGRLPSREKEERMARFAGGAADILVATSVVEVGVDIPNASIMVIEGAERFGLSQLHQFRGRVGRDRHESFCLLFQGGIDVDGSRRLEAVAATSGGFEIAELDLSLRGAGDVAGLRQHGLPEMMAADLLDAAMAHRARDAAQHWLDGDPDLLRHPPLREALLEYQSVFLLD